MPVVLLVLLLVVVPLAPQTPAALPGAWEGSIDLPGAPLRIAVVFQSGAGQITGTIDIPQQGAKALALRAITVDGPAVRFELVTGGPVAVFDGKLEGDRLAGAFTQGPFSGTFTLTRRAAAPAAAPPPPYRVEPLVVRNGDVTLGGTLTMPEGAGPERPVPAVVLITGSGPQNRDEEVFGFAVFGVLADHLTRRGIAVYRYDDRGVGDSTGNIAASTTEDFAMDALAAAAVLRARPGIDPARVGLLGHSEGGTAAAIAAARSPEIAFVAMLAGPALPGDQVLRQQSRDIAIARGATPAQVDRIVAAHEAAIGAVRAGASVDEQTRLVRALVEAQVDAAPAAQVAAIGANRAAYVDRTVAAAVAQMQTPWMTFLIAFDPATALRQVTVPVFAAFGALDTQVPPAQHLPALRAALAGNARTTLKIYAGANHLFQRAQTGQIDEYPSLDKAFVPELIDDLTRWMLAVGR